MKNKIYEYYSYTDDFAVTQDIRAKQIGDKYKYDSKNPFFFVFKFFIYYIIAKPLIFLIMKIGFHYKFVNKKQIQKYKGGCYIYGNHTNYLPDAFLPNLLRTKRNYIVTNADSVSIPGISTIVKGLGAVPLGDTLKAQKSFTRFLEKSIQKGQSVTIYPEAHIWPYYTGVRPFPKTSFRYPVLAQVPAFSQTICYQKRKIGKRPKVVCFIDGPFFPDESLPKREREQVLRNQIYETMLARTKEYSTYSIHTYIDKTAH